MLTKNPYNPHAPVRPPTPPTTSEAPEIPALAIKALKEIGATHLSKDGKVAYQLRYGSLRWAEWLETENKFGTWFPFAQDLPFGVIEINCNG